jgi:23S rRNA G2445 N2-methylase RlmL
MRCYRENKQFRPLPENIAAVIEIAGRTGNTELAEVLKHG